MKLNFKNDKCPCKWWVQKKYHLIANVDFFYYFFLILISKLITCFNWWFHFRNEIPIQLLNESEHIYIGLLTLRVRRTQYEFCGQGNLQGCKEQLFFEVWWIRLCFLVRFQTNLGGGMRVADHGPQSSS